MSSFDNRQLHIDRFKQDFPQLLKTQFDLSLDLILTIFRNCFLNTKINIQEGFIQVKKICEEQPFKEKILFEATDRSHFFKFICPKDNKDELIEGDVIYPFYPKLVYDTNLYQYQPLIEISEIHKMYNRTIAYIKNPINAIGEYKRLKEQARITGVQQIVRRIQPSIQPEDFIGYDEKIIRENEFVGFEDMNDDREKYKTIVIIKEINGPYVKKDRIYGDNKYYLNIIMIDFKGKEVKSKYFGAIGTMREIKSRLPLRYNVELRNITVKQKQNNNYSAWNNKEYYYNISNGIEDIKWWKEEGLYISYCPSINQINLSKIINIREMIPLTKVSFLGVLVNYDRFTPIEKKEEMVITWADECGKSINLYLYRKKDDKGYEDIEWHMNEVYLLLNVTFTSKNGLSLISDEDEYAQIIEEADIKLQDEKLADIMSFKEKIRNDPNIIIHNTSFLANLSAIKKKDEITEVKLIKAELISYNMPITLGLRTFQGKIKIDFERKHSDNEPFYRITNHQLCNNSEAYFDIDTNSFKCKNCKKYVNNPQYLLKIKAELEDDEATIDMEIFTDCALKLFGIPNTEDLARKWTFGIKENRDYFNNLNMITMNKYYLVMCKPKYEYYVQKQTPKLILYDFLEIDHMIH